MAKISKMVKENKLFDTKEFNALSPKEQDCVTEIFKMVEEGSDEAFILTKFDSAIEICSEKYGISKFIIDSFLENQLNEILREKV